MVNHFSDKMPHAKTVLVDVAAAISTHSAASKAIEPHVNDLNALREALDDAEAAAKHAAVRLTDGALIHLAPPWHPEAIRPDEERKLAGQPVVAKGLLFAECPPPPDGRAYARVACLHLGLKVLERSTYDFLHGRDPE
jgi:hypothetical protein